VKPEAVAGRLRRKKWARLFSLLEELLRKSAASSVRRRISNLHQDFSYKSNKR
jgi:hypothetical protein